MSELLKNIDARTKLAGTNKLELLLFSLGTDSRTGRKETFGINVFKVREVMRTPPITAAPDMPEAVEGMVSLRGALVPVVDLGKYAHVGQTEPREIMIVTEYNGHTQGFLVEAVDTILRLDWAQMKVPPEMLTARMGGLVTASPNCRRPPGDAARRRAGALRDDAFRRRVPVPRDQADRPQRRPGVFADDSSVARKQVQTTLERMGVKYVAAINGRQAWAELQKLAGYAESLGRPVREVVSLVLTDIEMPETDGYMLTKQIKSDPRFAGIPVLMHSSLSGMSNQQLGKSVGVDEYVSKFEPQHLAATIARLLERAPRAPPPDGRRHGPHRQHPARKRRCPHPLAGSNRMEILLFSLGTSEIFGINVFKVREVTRTPMITRTPNMPAGVEGLISLRGNVIPVVSLGSVLNLGGNSAEQSGTMMVTEYNKRTLGFLVHEVDRIIRVEWDKVRAPEGLVSTAQSFITAITELPPDSGAGQAGRLVSILDVEQIMAATFGEPLVATWRRWPTAASTTSSSWTTRPWRARRSPKCSTRWASSTSMP
jgi:two-component system chemotaxis response regulator CheV